MIFNATIRKLILEEQDDKLADAIRIGAEDGMQDFTMSLKDLVDKDLIDRATAFEVAPNVDELKMALKGINVKAIGYSVGRWRACEQAQFTSIAPATPFPCGISSRHVRRQEKEAG